MVFDITRREFLLVNISAAVYAALPAVFRPGLDDGERRTLLAVARTVFPHKHVDDSVYMRAIAQVEQRCQRHVSLGEVMKRGLASLEWTCGDSFATASEPTRVAALKAMQQSRFFEAAYREILEALYGPPEMWSLFVTQKTV